MSQLQDTITVYVNLLEEGTPTIRPTQAIVLGDHKVKLLPTSDYDPIDEIWEFLPGTIVACIDTFTDRGKPILLATTEASV